MTLLFNSHFGINAFTFYLPSHLLLVQKLEYKILFLKPRLLNTSLLNTVWKKVFFIWIQKSTYNNLTQKTVFL